MDVPCRRQENDKEMVANLLTFRAKLDVCVNTACDGNESYKYKLKEAWEAFLNARYSAAAAACCNTLDEMVSMVRCRSVSGVTLGGLCCWFAGRVMMVLCRRRVLLRCFALIAVRRSSPNVLQAEKRPVSPSEDPRRTEKKGTRCTSRMLCCCVLLACR